MTAACGGLETWLRGLRSKELDAVYTVFVEIPGCLPEHSLQTLSRYFDQAEQDRARALRREPDRQRFIVSRALLRTVAAAAAGVDHRGLHFDAAPGSGRPPRLQGVTRLNLSLSRSGRFVACAASRDAVVGIDIEQRRRVDGLWELAEIALNPEEQRQLASLPSSRQEQCFLRYWTAKEAALKAHGTGLAISPRQAGVETGTGGLPVQVSILQQGQRTDYAISSMGIHSDPGAIGAIASDGGEPLQLCEASVDELSRLLK